VKTFDFGLFSVFLRRRQATVFRRTLTNMKVVVMVVIVRNQRVKTACGHMMPPPLHVCNGLASPADAACRM